MDPRDIREQDRLTSAKSMPDLSLLRAGLLMANAHPFAMGEDGELDLVNPGDLAIRLHIPLHRFSTSRAEWESRLTGSDRAARERAIRTLTWDGARYSLDYTLTDGQGGTVHMREIAEAIAVADGRATLIHGVLIDRTEQVEAVETVAWTARHDPETGLPSETAVREILELTSGLADRFGVKTHLIRLRITNFDSLTQIYGPEIRAALLKEARRRLYGIVSAPDYLGRLDNGDWAVILTGPDSQALQDRMGEALSRQAVPSRFGDIDLTIEAAHMFVLPGPDGARGALERLNASLNGVSATDPSPRSAPQAFNVIKALEDDRISLAFQPIVHADTGALAHHECLLRLRQSDGQVISAGPLVMQAEQDGLVDQLDRRALALAVPHLEAHPELHLALNVSAATVTDETIAQDYLDALRALGPLATCLTIEMTETLAVDDPTQAADFARSVKALGCRFSIDDFGAGYTTFRNLMAIDADSVKIDGALIAGIATDQNKQTFMRMMVDLAETVGVKTVAEMVETKADADMLCRLGVDYLQGYYFGHPSASPVWSRLNR